MIKNVIIVPAKLTLNNVPNDVLTDYDKLCTILSVNDVLKYHRLNTVFRQIYKNMSLVDFKLEVLNDKYQQFLSKHVPEYEILCRDIDISVDSFFDINSKFIIEVDHALNVIFIKVTGCGDTTDNVKTFLNKYAEAYGPDSMMLLDMAKQAL